MGWRADHEYDLAREADRRAYLALLTRRERLAMEARRLAPFLAGAAAAGLILWMLLG